MNGIKMLLESYINKFNQLKVLCIGDIMLDQFFYGEVKRISPEAPVPVFHMHSQKEMLGGAGNVIANLAALHCQPHFIGVVGNDKEGRKIKSLIRKMGIKSHILTHNAYQTIVKTRFIASNNHLLRADREEKFPDLSLSMVKIRKIVKSAIRMADIVLLSDYAKGTLTPQTTQEIISICNEYGTLVLADPKGREWEKYQNATLVKPNLKEFNEAAETDADPDKEDFLQKIKSGATVLFKKYNIKHLIVTLSKNGMLHISALTPEKVTHIPTVAKEVFDVSGAGDTALAVLGCAIAAGAEITEAMKLANIASGIEVGKLGTAAVSSEEISQAVSNRQTDKWIQKNKIVSLTEAEKIAAEYKEKKLKIGFTNGCFDLLHLGHLNSFMLTKKECDVLFVGINSDSSVKKLKGENRPIQDEKTRALLLASLEFIDYVIVFDDENALPLVEKIRPDIIAKEGYKIADWPEAQKVISYGGKAITLPRLEGYSTSSIFCKMKG